MISPLIVPSLILAVLIAIFGLWASRGLHKKSNH